MRATLPAAYRAARESSQLTSLRYKVARRKGRWDERDPWETAWAFWPVEFDRLVRHGHEAFRL